MDDKDYLDRQVAEHRALVDTAWDAVRDPFGQLLAACVAAAKSGGKILLFGNGGSAADAQHIAAELCVRYLADRDPVAALALTTDTSILTAAANDMGFDSIFARQVTALGRPGDVAIGLSTSGASPNVIAGLKAAKEKGMTAAALLGKDGGFVGTMADPALVVPSDSTARIQEIHILLGHMLCGALERELGLGDG